MKLLIVSKRIDLLLRHRLEALKAAGVDVTCVTIYDYRLHDAQGSRSVEPESPFEFLERKGHLRSINRLYKRRKMLRAIAPEYDVVDLCRLGSQAALLRSVAERAAPRYVVSADENDLTPSSLPPVNMLRKKLYRKAHAILFENALLQDEFKERFSQIRSCAVVHHPIPLIDTIDTLDEEALARYAAAFELDREKEIVYCDMSGALERQSELLRHLASLPKEQRSRTTFILPMLYNDFETRRSLKKQLEGMDLDFLLLDGLLTPEQRAALFLLANKTIVLSVTPTNDTLPAALYARSELYLYKLYGIDPIYERMGIFIDDFKNFSLTPQDPQARALLQEILTKNSKKVADIFAPAQATQRYLKELA